MSMHDYNTTTYGRLFKVVSTLHDNDPVGAMAVLEELQPDAIEGILGCAQAEQHKVWGMAREVADTIAVLN